MSFIDWLWIPAVLGWLPLIYASELSALAQRLAYRRRQRRARPARASQGT